MTMKTLTVLALGVALFSAAYAQTYQWKDSSGKTIISDTPPPGSAAKSARTLGAQQPSVFKEIKPAEKASDAPKSAAEQDMEFKKRQQQKAEQAEKDAKEQKAAADKRENCERARRNLAALESNQPFTSIDDKGTPQVVDDTSRQQEIQRTRQIVAESCM